MYENFSIGVSLINSIPQFKQCPPSETAERLDMSIRPISKEAEIGRTGVYIIRRMFYWPIEKISVYSPRQYEIKSKIN